MLHGNKRANRGDGVPFSVGHVLEGLIFKDTGIVDENGYGAKCIDSCLDYRGSVGDRGAVDDCLSSGYIIS